MTAKSSHWKIRWLVFGALLVAFFRGATAPSSATPLLATDTGVGPVMALALDSSGSGWAWASAAPQKPATRYLLRIEDGSWHVVSDSVKDPELLPLGATISKMVVTGDGKDGWAIGSTDDASPLFWRFQSGAWKAVNITVPAGATQPRGLSISADGNDGWMTVLKPSTSEYSLLRLRTGAWSAVAQPSVDQLEIVSISADGKSGWGLGSPRPNSPQAIHKLQNGTWDAKAIEILDRGAKATDLASDNAGSGWILVDNERLFRLNTKNELVDSYTAEKDAVLNAVAVDGSGRGWAVGWHDLGQQTQPGNTQYLRKPVLVRLAGDASTPWPAVQAAAFAPDDIGPTSLALTADGAQAWAGAVNMDGFGLLAHFHEPWQHPVQEPAVAPPLAGPGQCFDGVPYCLRGVFLQFWQAHGGVDDLGLPVTTEIYEKLGDKTYRVQYTERARLEEHHENAGTANEVQLGLLGNELADPRAGEGPFKPVPSTVIGTARWFEPTQHAIDRPFLTYWLDNGDLQVFGYPRSEGFEEKSQADGKVYLVQYFERNRVEYHPENQGTKYEFLLGLLGVEQFAKKYKYTP